MVILIVALHKRSATKKYTLIRYLVTLNVLLLTTAYLLSFGLIPNTLPKKPVF